MRFYQIFRRSFERHTLLLHARNARNPAAQTVLLRTKRIVGNRCSDDPGRKFIVPSPNAISTCVYLYTMSINVNHYTTQYPGQYLINLNFMRRFVFSSAGWSRLFFQSRQTGGKRVNRNGRSPQLSRTVQWWSVFRMDVRRTQNDVHITFCVEYAGRNAYIRIMVSTARACLRYTRGAGYNPDGVRSCALTILNVYVSCWTLRSIWYLPTSILFNPFFFFFLLFCFSLRSKAARRRARSKLHSRRVCTSTPRRMYKRTRAYECSHEKKKPLDV
jgi:hypothetical protein